ncbi:MAG: hypothetical protein GXP16_17025 [Gammaproteobacteria bacterium]|nr:hypothetical protein [Gammaproteobacteria bacterium]
MRALTISKATNRTVVFDFIKKQFQFHYDAVINDEGRDLYTAIDRSGNLQAAFCTNNDPNEFISAHYTGNVIAALEKGFMRSMHGCRVIELTHLALLQPRSLCQLNSTLVEFLSNRSDYLVCTVVKPIADFFQRKSFAPIELAAASLEALPEQQQHCWGSYYSHSPVVMAGDMSFARTVSEVATSP